MPFNRGRPRAEGVRRRYTVEVSEPIAAAIERVAERLPDITIRAIIEEGLRLWLAQHGVPVPGGVPGEEPNE